jgi:hypothetical protein
VLPVPSKIVNTQLNRGRWEVLVRWEGQAAGAATSEFLDDFKQDHPGFQLEDELFVKEGGVLWMHFMVDTLGVARRKQSGSSRRQSRLSRRWDQLAEDKHLVGC